MTFFYDLNQRLASIAQRQQLTESTHLDEKHMGFAKLEKDIARSGDVRDPAAVAASIGRKKYGKEKFQKAAAAGRKLGEAPNEGNEFSGELAKAKAAGAKEFSVDGKTYPVKEANAFPGTDDYKRRYGTDIESFRLRHAPSVMRDPAARKELSKMDTDLDRLKKMRRGELDPNELGDEPPAGEKRGRGRPKGSKRAIGAKGPTGRSKLLRMAEDETGIRDDLAYEIEQILDGAIEGTDQTDHIIDELGDLYDRIESSGDKVALKAYSMMNGSIDQGTHAQVRAAQMALKRLKGDIKEDYDRDEYDEEGEMAKSQSRTIEDAAEELQSILDADENLPEWVQKKITLAMDYIDTARDYLKANRPEDQGMEESALQAHIGKKKYGAQGMKALQQAGRDGAGPEKMAKIRAQHDKLDEVDLEEKAVSKAQRAAAGIAHAAKKGEIPRSRLQPASRAMADMPAKELRKFAKTKEKGLPDRVREGGAVDPNRHPQTRDYGRGKDDDLPFRADDTVSDRDEFGNPIKNVARHLARKGMRKAMDTKAKTKNKDEEAKVDETTTSGSVAASTAEPAKKSKGGMQFGKGIYDSMNRELESMIAESMSINMSDSTEGGRSLTVTATDDDAMQLAAMLKMAGMGSMSHEQGEHGGCDAMEEAYGDVAATENQPDYPTNTEVSDDALQYSGGLNRPKSTGQTTVPVIASQLDRQGYEEAEEIDEVARMREMAGIGEARKPDFPDLDNDGDRKESIAKAAQDAEEEKVDEAVEQSLWNLYKRIA